MCCQQEAFSKWPPGGSYKDLLVLQFWLQQSVCTLQSTDLLYLYWIMKEIILERKKKSFLACSGFLVHYKPASGVNVWPLTNLPAVKAVTFNSERDKCVNSVGVNFTSSPACRKSNYAIKSVTPQKYEPKERASAFHQQRQRRNCSSPGGRRS